MTQTSTPPPDLSLLKISKKPENESCTPAEPSSEVIRNILSYSRNLEVKQSKLIENIELLKS